jgi:hypothetical protein
MGFVGDTVGSIRSMQIRQVLAQIIGLGETRYLNLPLVSLSPCLAVASRPGVSFSGSWCRSHLSSWEK